MSTSKRGRLTNAFERGYVAAASGALAGGVAGGAAFGGIAFALLTCEDGGLECLGVALLAAGIGILGGLACAIAGCYWALRLRGHDRAGRTAGLFAALLPVAGALMVALAGVLTIFAPVLAIVGAALGARRLAIGRSAPERLEEEGTG